MARRPQAPARDLTLHVHGMTCAACERRIERKVGALAGVEAVHVSHRTGRLTVRARRGVRPAAVTGAVRDAGYAVGDGAPRLFSRDPRVWRQFVLAAVAVACLAALFFALEGDRLAGSVSRAAQGGSLLLVVLLGVAASVSTCMALVGGLVLGVAGRYAARHPEAGWARRMRPQVLFHVGRIAGFAALGAALGLAGAALRPSARLLAVVTIAVALVMAKLGLTMTGIAPGLSARLSFAPPRRLTDRFEGAGAGSGAGEGWLAVALGVGSFFLPCAFTQAVQLYALSTGSPWRAAAVMGLFALGTVPGLLGMAAAGSWGGAGGGGGGGVGGGLGDGSRGERRVEHEDRREGRAAVATRVLGVVVLAFSLVNAAGAVSVLNPGLFAGPVTAASARSSNVRDDGGVQVVETVQGDFGYRPADAVVYAGEPVRWVITMEARSCASLMALDSLGLGTVELNYPTTVLEFTPSAPGVLNYSCAMGMFRGSFQVIERPA